MPYSLAFAPRTGQAEIDCGEDRQQFWQEIDVPNDSKRSRPTTRFPNCRIGVPASACALLLTMTSLTGCANSHSPLASNANGIPAGYNEPHRSGWNPSSERPVWLRDLPPELERERSADDGYGAHLG